MLHNFVKIYSMTFLDPCIWVKKMAEKKEKQICVTQPMPEKRTNN